jgi:hypothetical protein
MGSEVAIGRVMGEEVQGVNGCWISRKVVILEDGYDV